MLLWKSPIVTNHQIRHSPCHNKTLQIHPKCFYCHIGCQLQMYGTSSGTLLIHVSLFWCTMDLQNKLWCFETASFWQLSCWKEVPFEEHQMLDSKHFAPFTSFYNWFNQLSPRGIQDWDRTSASVLPTLLCSTFLWHSSTVSSTTLAFVGRRIGYLWSNVSIAFFSLPPHQIKSSSWRYAPRSCMWDWKSCCCVISSWTAIKTKTLASFNSSALKLLANFLLFLVNLQLFVNLVTYAT